MQKSKSKPISPKIEEVTRYMKERVGVGKSYDFGYREVVILKRKVQLYYVNGLVESSIVVRMMQELVNLADHEFEYKKAPEIIENRLIHEQVEKVKTYDEAVDQVLSGLIAIFVDGYDQAFIIDVRHYPGRSPEEPDTERVIRGARDGFTENIVENTGLTRRRIRDERLRHEMFKVGERSKTDVCIGYLQDVADNDFVSYAKERIQSIEVAGVPMADKTVEEFILGHKWSPLPMVRYTERPDVAASHLMDGHVILYIDTSPSVIILPTTFFNCLEHAEEYRQSPLIGTYIRWTRLLAVMLSIFLLPFWLLFTLEPAMLPDELAFIGPNKEGNIPIVLQILMAGIGVEFMRMAAVHTPTPLATALGLIAAVLIGDIAIQVGMLSSEVILYVAIATIGSYVTPSYELSVANKMLMFFLLIVTAIFKADGFVVGTLILLLYLISIKAFRTPYLWPFIPFDARAMARFLMRYPVPYVNSRPNYVHPKNIYTQPLKTNSRNK
ncbi:spore germination protein [Virgibacillus sp. 179-BFC.A HS]|uniref:Spore germination protein n=1 Tax=Tigheibacillus jepli TaxID=3035914 RepID=A0ABU5CJF3_9BACI|nr:spore germination protein [Virgibacillus sp. 179-BFC.A HS]MDY0405653.1 spore germination protein [Virgibacillus sp. 179-BFC.A HS]